MRISPRGFRPPVVFDSFLGLLDIKSGAELIMLFGLLNKVAGVYGLISLFTGGDFFQLVFYTYSSATLVVCMWGLGVVKEENTTSTLTLAHLYTLDHALSSLFTIHFARAFIAAPHDGRRVVNSVAQQDLIDLAVSRGEVRPPTTGGGAERETARVAMGLWEQERMTAGFVLVLSWAVKVYFIAILYSYAGHLRRNTYHALPLSSSPPKRAGRLPIVPGEGAGVGEEETLEILSGDGVGRSSEGVERSTGDGPSGGGLASGATAGNGQTASAAATASDAHDADDFKWDSDDERDRDSGADVDSPREDKKIAAGKMD